MDHKIIAVGADSAILTLDKETGIVTLAPTASSSPGTFDSYNLQFFYKDFPLIYLNIPIEVTIEECVPEYAEIEPGTVQ